MIDTYHDWLFTSYNEVNVGIFANSLNYWTAVIDSIRCHKIQSHFYIFWLSESINRFFNWLIYRWYVLNESKYDIKKIIIKLILINNYFDHPYIRLIAYIWDDNLDTMNSWIHFCASILNLEVPDRSMKSVFSWFCRSKDDSNNHKLSSNYSKNIIEERKARISWYDNVIFLWQDEEILECLSENIFVVVNNIIYTPDMENIVNGIYRRLIIGILQYLWYSVIQKNISKEFIQWADEVFICWSATWIRNIVSIWNNWIISDKKISTTIKSFLCDEITLHREMWGISISRI